MMAIRYIMQSLFKLLFHNWGGVSTLCNLFGINYRYFLLDFTNLFELKLTSKTIFLLGKNKFLIRKPLFLN